MRYYNVLNLSLQQIQIFLKVVQLRNYTRVAAQMNFSVSMISKTIAAMEKETGLILFLRSPREMIPTPAARVLAQEWRSIITTVEQSMEKAHTAQDGARSMVTLGFIDSSVTMDQRLQLLLSQFEAIHPEVDIRVEKLDMHDLVEHLNTGELDIIITAHHEAPALEANDLPCKMLIHSKLAAYVPRSSPLFNRPDIRFADLRNESFIIPSPFLHANYYSMFEQLCSRHGFVPKIAVTAPNVRSMMYSLRLQKGVVLGDQFTRDWACEDIRQFTLEEDGGSIIAWNRCPDHACMELVAFLTRAFDT